MGFAAAYSMSRQTFHQKRSRFPTPFIGIEGQKGKSRAQSVSKNSKVTGRWLSDVETPFRTKC